MKKSGWGKVQICIGILLFVSSFALGIYSYNSYGADSTSAERDFIEQIRFLSNESFNSEELKLITSIAYSQGYIIENRYIKLRFITLESLSVVIFIISILFVIQGIINSKRD